MPGTLGLGLGGKQLAPAARADVPFHEFACIRRLEVDAAVAVLVALRCSLIFGVATARETTAAAVAAPNESAALVSRARRETRRQLFMIDHIGLDAVCRSYRFTGDRFR